MTDDDTLFPAPESLPGAPRLGEDARRTQRATALLNAGYHPLLSIRLHPDAPPVDDRTAPGPRCGNCGHAAWKQGASHRWLKCGEHLTAGPATDLRAWWPGCAAWTPNNNPRSAA